MRYLSAIAELRHVQSTEIIRAATRNTMMSRNPAAGGVCGRESALCTTGGSMIVLTDTRLMLVPRPPCCVDHPPQPEASPDRPGEVSVSRIVARNRHHPEPYTGTRTVLVRSSRPRPHGRRRRQNLAQNPPPCAGRDPKLSQATRNAPGNFGSAAGGFTRAPGGRAGSKPESAESPAGLEMRGEYGG